MLKYIIDMAIAGASRARRPEAFVRLSRPHYSNSVTAGLNVLGATGCFVHPYIQTSDSSAHKKSLHSPRFLGLATSVQYRNIFLYLHLIPKHNALKSIRL